MKKPPCIFPNSLSFQIWYSFAGLLFLSIFFLLTSPLITLTFRIGEFFWGYSYLDENSPISVIYRKVAEVIVVGPFAVAAILHFVIFVVVTYKVGSSSYTVAFFVRKVLSGAMPGVGRHFRPRSGHDCVD